MLSAPRLTLLLCFLPGLCSATVHANTNFSWSVSSPATQATMIELYTSQGCSSCPPADQWLSNLQHHPQLFSQLVPISFHVTYWNYLGWADPFALPANDTRHREQARHAGSGVYTPGMFAQGREWRGWRQQPLPAQIVGRNVGVLSATAAGDRIELQFAPGSNTKLQHPQVTVTYLAMARSAAVNAGENRGRQLHHDFVAGELTHVPLQKSADTWRGHGTLAMPHDATAVALWLVDAEREFIQATGAFVGKVEQTRILPGPEQSAATISLNQQR